MMGGGVCWLDYNNDGWLDLFVVNWYARETSARYSARGGLPRTALFRNDHGRFVNVTGRTHAGLPFAAKAASQPTSTVTATRISTSRRRQAIELLWNNGNGTFTEGARVAGRRLVRLARGCRRRGCERRRPARSVRRRATRRRTAPSPARSPASRRKSRRSRSSLPERGERPDGRALPRGRDDGRDRSGRLRPLARRGLHDVNGDGRPDLYVANDKDPNQLYVEHPVPGGAKADPAGSGSASTSAPRPGRRGSVRRHGRRRRRRRRRPLDLFVTNSRNEPPAAFTNWRPRRRSRARGPTSTRRSAPTSRAGATPGST